MDRENIKTISRKYRIYPNENQRKFLNKLIGGYRHYYNKTIDYIKIIEENRYW
jgi:hypothetical protein